VKRVAVSQRVDVHAQRGESRDALDQRLSDFLLAAGCLPVPVPNRLAAGGAGAGPLRRWLAALLPEALLLSGGNDIGQCPDRDLTERELLAAAGARDLPVLGICRGMQMLGVQAGALLEASPGHAGVRHRVAGGLEGDVNSYHDYALAACPEGYDVLARADDGRIEAIRHRSRRWEGWMWHPEREARFDERDLRRLRALFGCEGAAR
jgi:N5-(cytidine 5'-diphosphoramidyl)-L-glutamine hydrolase